MARTRVTSARVQPRRAASQGTLRGVATLPGQRTRLPRDAQGHPSLVLLLLGLRQVRRSARAWHPCAKRGPWAVETDLTAVLLLRGNGASRAAPGGHRRS